MIYHKYRFGLLKNIKVFICKKFGHRINENPAYHWCERCGLAYEECYYPLDYFVQSGLVKVDEKEMAEYLVEQEMKEQKFKNKNPIK